MQIIEDYKRIAQQQGFLFGSMEENRTFIIPNDRMLNTRNCFLSNNEMVYYAYDSYAAKVGMSSTYSGVYTAISNSFNEFQAEISKHFWIDFITGRKKVKTNDSFIDKYLSISTNNVEQLLRIIDMRIAKDYLDLWDKYAPVKIVVGIDYLQSIVAFKGKLIIGVELNEWVLPERFEQTFNDFQGIITEMIMKLNRHGRDV